MSENDELLNSIRLSELGKAVEAARGVRPLEGLQANTLNQYVQVTKQVLREIAKDGELPDLTRLTRKGAVATRAAFYTVILDALKRYNRVSQGRLCVGAMEAAFPAHTDTLGKSIWKEAKKDTKKNREYAKFERKNPDWQTQMFFQYSKKEHKVIAAIMTLCGARPAEIEKGIGVILGTNEDKTVMLFQIEGAKRTEHSGQPWRVVVIDVNEKEEVQYLFNHVKSMCAGKEYRMSFEMKAETIGKLVTRCANKLGYKVTPYYYRHAFARYLKNISNREGVAVAMGHLIDKTQGFYGSSSRKEKSKVHNNLSVVEVQAAREIKMRDIPNYIKLAKEHSRSHNGPELTL